MASILFTVGGAVVNALAFSGNNFVFSRVTGHFAEERKRHDLALEKLQRARDEWNRDRMKRLDLIKKRLLERNEARAYIKNADEAMLEYYRVFAKKKKKTLPHEPELSDFHPPSENQNNGELLFVIVGTGIATYAQYKYLK